VKTKIKKQRGANMAKLYISYDSDNVCEINVTTKKSQQ
jgi:hypothetical protein